MRAGLNYLDETGRFSTTKKGREMYHVLKAGNDKFQPFETQSQIYVLALSVGILSNEKVENERFDENLFVYQAYLNQDPLGVFPLIIKSMFPELDKNGVIQMMDRYAEGGLRILYNKYMAYKKIDFQELMKLRTTE